MKKLLFIIGFITLIGCTENTYITELEEIEVENPVSDCWRIISANSGNPQCETRLSITVVRADLFGTRDARGLLICVTNSEYTIDNFRLGQTLCDLSIYN